MATKTLRSRGHRVLLAVLIETRKKAGLTQQQLADRLRLDQSAVARIETGDRRIDPVECTAWGKACGMKGKAFLGLIGRRLDMEI